MKYQDLLALMSKPLVDKGSVEIDQGRAQDSEGGAQGRKESSLAPNNNIDLHSLQATGQIPINIPKVEQLAMKDPNVGLIEDIPSIHSIPSIRPTTRFDHDDFDSEPIDPRTGGPQYKLCKYGRPSGMHELTPGQSKPFIEAIEKYKKERGIITEPDVIKPYHYFNRGSPLCMTEGGQFGNLKLDLNKLKQKPYTLVAYNHEGQKVLERENIDDKTLQFLQKKIHNKDFKLSTKGIGHLRALFRCLHPMVQASVEKRTKKYQMLFGKLKPAKLTDKEILENLSMLVDNIDIGNTNPDEAKEIVSLVKVIQKRGTVPQGTVTKLEELIRSYSIKI